MMGQATGCSRLQALAASRRLPAPSSGIQSTRTLTTTSMGILRVLWVILAKSGTVLRDPEHASVHRLQRRVRREPHVLEPREDDAPEAHAR